MADVPLKITLADNLAALEVPSVHCEVRKVAYRQTRDGLVVSLLVHPNDMPDALAVAPLGTRYMIALAQIGDDEQPIPRGQSLGAATDERPDARILALGNVSDSPARDHADTVSQDDPGERPDEPVLADHGSRGEPSDLPPGRPFNGVLYDRSFAGKARYAAMPPMEQARVRAGRLCKDERFRRWLAGPNVMPPDEAAAADIIRDDCGVLSRSEIATDPEAYARFIALETEYMRDTGQLPEMRG